MSMAHVDKRIANRRMIDDVLDIRSDAVTLGLRLTVERWKPRYSSETIEDVVFYRIHRTIIAGAAQYEAERD